MYSEHLNSFENVQNKFGDIPGDKGISLRRKHYASHFLGFGGNITIEQGCRFYHTNRVVLDDEVKINRECLIYGSGGVRIGRHVRIGPRCFIHSANHDINRSLNLAYHEKGYIEDAVTIGDLCLLSANVSIMPGVRLGAGCFVACGAVVAGGLYPEKSRLLGVPARIRDQKPISGLGYSPSPEIALLVEDMDQWKGFARQLVTVLGLPQAGIFVDHREIPASCKAVLAIGSSTWRSPLPNAWRLHDGQFESPPTASLPSQIRLPTIPSSAGALDAIAKNSPEIALRRASFWFFNRLRKRRAPLSCREWREWTLAFKALDKITAPQRSFIPEDIRTSLRSLRPFFAHYLESWFSKLLRWASRNIHEPSYIVSTALNKKINVNLSFFIKDPSQIPENFTSAQLSALFIAAFLTGAKKEAEQIYQQIEMRIGIIKDLLIPKAKADSTRPCWSPFAFAATILRAHQMYPNLKTQNVFSTFEDAGYRLTWKCLAEAKFFDPDKKLVSRCLVENWIAIHTAKLPEGMQFYLTNDFYKLSSNVLEKIWLEIFRCMMNDLPLLQIQPWPAGYKAALSLRLDADRPVSAGTIRKIAKIQQKFTRSPCASWFYFPADKHKESQMKVLLRHFQEVGVHLLGHGEAQDVQNKGITYHSGIESAYWEGQKSLINLSKKSVEYSEFLSFRFRTARPVYFPGNLQQDDLWATPLHFPLEGSSKERDLSYFCELKSYYLDQFAQGGHAILATHPDINLKLLKKALKRFSGNDRVWKATIGDVVKRQKLLLTPGQIRTFRNDNNFFVVSKNTIADVAIDLWIPKADSPKSLSINLIANQPKQLF